MLCINLYLPKLHVNLNVNVLFEQQILNVDDWIHIPNNKVTFPALLNTHKSSLNLNLESKLDLLIEANYRVFNIHQNIEKCLVS